jgi:DNA-directed RNA polymerase subunit RPC12/RpoP
MVEEENVSRALELIFASEQFFLQSVPCPVCKTKNLEMVVKTTYFNNWFQKIKSRLINGQEEEIKKYYKCNWCKTEFQQLPIES